MEPVSGRFNAYEISYNVLRQRLMLALRAIVATDGHYLVPLSREHASAGG